MSELRLTTAEQVAAHSAAVAAIVITDEALAALTVLVKPMYKMVLQTFKLLKEYSPRSTLRARCIRNYNVFLAKVHNLPSKLAKSGLVLSALEEALLTHAPNLLYLASDGKRFLAPKMPTEPRAPVPHVDYGTGADPEVEETRCLFASRRHRLAGGPDGIRYAISSALTCVRDGFTPVLRYHYGWLQEQVVGLWSGYYLELFFTNATDGSSIRIPSNDKRIQNALMVQRPVTKKKTLDAFGTEVNNQITTKIKDMLRERDLRNQAEDLPPSHDALVYCCENTCKHASGYLTIRDHLSYSSCSNGHHTCFKCMSPRHVGDCDTAAAMDAETRELLVVSSKPCPGCHMLITKNDGCNHMTCRCGQHFCWKCLKPFSSQVRWIAHDSDDGVTCTIDLNVYGGHY